MANITLRNTLNGVTAEFEENYARRILADPFLGKNQIEVKSDKPEVLSQPYTVDGDGNRKVDSTADNGVVADGFDGPLDADSAGNDEARADTSPAEPITKASTSTRKGKE